MAKENYLNGKKILKKESWNLRKEGRTEEKAKVRVYTISFASPVEFSQLCLTVET